jgi:hypothetical protein
MKIPPQLELSLTDRRLIREFNESVRWLKTNGVTKTTEWISYEQAREILPNSKTWYREARNEKKILVEGKDWRRVGKKVQYNKASIINLNTWS